MWLQPGHLHVVTVGNGPRIRNQRSQKSMYVFFWIFYILTSNDLESGMIEVNGPRIRNQRPQKPMYVNIFLDFLQFDLQMTLNLIWWRSTDLGFEISDPKNLCVYFSGFFAVWPSNDLESNMIEVNGPRIQKLVFETITAIYAFTASQTFPENAWKFFCSRRLVQKKCRDRSLFPNGSDEQRAMKYPNITPTLTTLDWCVRADRGARFFYVRGR